MYHSSIFPLSRKCGLDNKGLLRYKGNFYNILGKVDLKSSYFKEISSEKKTQPLPSVLHDFFNITDNYFISYEF